MRQKVTDFSARTYLSVVRHEEGGGAVELHEVFGEEAHPGVVPVEDNLPPRRLGLPDEVVLQQRRRIQVHHHVDEAWDAASGESLGDGYSFIL